jgi:hypothetical protein
MKHLSADGPFWIGQATLDLRLVVEERGSESEDKEASDDGHGCLQDIGCGLFNVILRTRRPDQK